MTQNKKELTTEQLQHAINAMRARLAAIDELISAFKYKGKYYEVARYYTETMGIWPNHDFTGCSQYTGDDFWEERPELSEKLDKIESALGNQDYHSFIDNCALDVGLKYSRDCCEAILNHLVDELAERERQRDMTNYTIKVSKKLVRFVQECLKYGKMASDLDRGQEMMLGINYDNIIPEDLEFDVGILSTEHDQTHILKPWFAKNNKWERCIKHPTDTIVGEYVFEVYKGKVKYTFNVVAE